MLLGQTIQLSVSSHIRHHGSRARTPCSHIIYVDEFSLKNIQYYTFSTTYSTCSTCAVLQYQLYLYLYQLASTTLVLQLLRSIMYALVVQYQLTACVCVCVYSCSTAVQVLQLYSTRDILHVVLQPYDPCPARSCIAEVCVCVCVLYVLHTQGYEPYKPTHTHT